MGVSALPARESGEGPLGCVAPGGWGKPRGRSLKMDNQTSSPVIDLVQKIPLFIGAAGFLSHERSFPEPPCVGRLRGGALVEVGGTPILISPESMMQEPPAVTLK